ncbi:MAG: NAD-dependent epimerase/dehydratase family protein, partial [Candidatus Paceibacterota bacterium]
QDTKYNSPFHQFIDKARKGEDIEVWGNPPKTVRDMIYVKDVCRAFILAIEKKDVHGWYNIGSGKGLTIKEEVKEIISVFSPWEECPEYVEGNVVANYREKMSKIIYRPDIEEVRTHSCIFLINKAVKELGWWPLYTYHDALVDMKEEMEAGET